MIYFIAALTAIIILGHFGLPPEGIFRAIITVGVCRLLMQMDRLISLKKRKLP